MRELQNEIVIRSVCTGRMFESVCLFVRIERNSKTKDLKEFKLSKGISLGYPISDMVLGLKSYLYRAAFNVRVMVTINSNTVWIRTQ